MKLDLLQKPDTLYTFGQTGAHKQTMPDYRYIRTVWVLD